MTASQIESGCPRPFRSTYSMGCSSMARFEMEWSCTFTMGRELLPWNSRLSPWKR